LQELAPITLLEPRSSTCPHTFVPGGNFVSPTRLSDVPTSRRTQPAADSKPGEPLRCNRWPGSRGILPRTEFWSRPGSCERPRPSKLQSRLEAYNAGEWQSAYVQLIGPAENGDSQAQGMIGQYVGARSGAGVDIDAAVEWYLKASFRNSVASWNLGTLYAMEGQPSSQGMVPKANSRDFPCLPRLQLPPPNALNAPFHVRSPGEMNPAPHPSTSSASKHGCFVGTGDLAFEASSAGSSFPADARSSRSLAWPRTRATAYSSSTAARTRWSSSTAMAASSPPWGDGLFRAPPRNHDRPDDSVYLTDDVDHTVRKFTPAGKLLLTLGTSGRPSDTGVIGHDYRTIQRMARLFVCPRISPLAFGDMYNHGRLRQREGP
jgi:hypothetical protein